MITQFSKVREIIIKYYADQDKLFSEYQKKEIQYE